MSLRFKVDETLFVCSSPADRFGIRSVQYVIFEVWMESSSSMDRNPPTLRTWAKHLFLKLELKSATLWTKSETADILCCKGLEMSRALVVENPILALSTFVKRKCRDSFSAEHLEAFVTVGFGRDLTCASSFFSSWASLEAATGGAKLEQRTTSLPSLFHSLWISGCLPSRVFHHSLKKRGQEEPKSRSSDAVVELLRNKLIGNCFLMRWNSNF